ncbi:MAG: sensor histidine kinase [Aliishimia sp.]
MIIRDSYGNELQIFYFPFVTHINLTRLIGVVLLYLLPLGLSAQGSLELSRDQVNWLSIGPTVAALRDPTQSLSLEDAQVGNFMPLESETANFGYTQDYLWLRFDVVNRSEADEFVLAMRENFLPHYEVWLVAASGEVKQLDSQTASSRYQDRRVRYPELATPLPLKPGEAATVYINYASGGSSELSWRIMSRQRFDQWGATRTARNFIYYGMGLLLSVASAISWIVTRRTVFGAYSFYALAGLLFVMHADGNTFQYLWPNMPLFNTFASIPLGVFIIVSGLNFAQIFLNTSRYHPRLNFALLMMIAVTLLVGVSPIVVDAQPVKRLLILLSLITSALLAMSGLIAARTRFREVRFYVIAWMAALLASGLMTMRHWFDFEISKDLQFDTMRVVLIFDAILMGFAILDRFNWLKQSQREALEVSLAQSRKTVELNLRMQDLEHQAGIAEKLASSQQRNLTQTAHDLRQPLNALRLNLRNIMGEEKDPELLNDVEDTLGYLETLVAEQLSNALVGEQDRSSDETLIGPVFSSVTEMFAADAKEKGLRLICVESSLSVMTPPLVLMRIATNLVANAIKATQSGGIVIGVRHAGGVRIEIHDTGSGLAKSRFDAVLKSARQAPSENGGTGLGLPIVAQLSKQHGIRFERVDGLSSGTILRLWLP